MTQAEKDKRYAYAKTRRHKLNAAMREAGIIGAPRPKMSEPEKKTKRKAYSKDYRARINAEAKAYREMMSGEAPKTRRSRKG